MTWYFWPLLFIVILSAVFGAECLNVWFWRRRIKPEAARRSRPVSDFWSPTPKGEKARRG